MVEETKIAKGFKQTEVGVIPEDWEVRYIKDISTSYSGGTPNTSNINFYGNEIPFIASGELNQKRIRKTSKGITNQGLNNSSAKIVEKGTLLIAMYGATAGVTAIAEIKGAINQAVLAILTKAVDSEYLFNWFLLNKEKIISIYTQGGQPNLSGGLIKQIKIPLPPTRVEQTAIATALSDMDALIEGLEKLIAKKRNIKQGAMQELLKPKEGWRVKELGKIAEINTGKKNNQDKIDNGQYPFFVRSQNIERINTYSFDGEAILIPGEGNIGKIFHYINGKFDYHQRVYKISNFKDGYICKYIYCYMSEYFGKHALKNTVKATVDSLRLPTFQIFEIPFPLDPKKQTEIANSLFDMDAEIEKLETQLSKCKMLKTGMMQELLTGKKRLNHDLKELEDNHD